MRGQNNPTKNPGFSIEEVELIQQAYDRYDSDSRACGPHGYEAFADAVVFALRRAALDGVRRIYRDDAKGEGFSHQDKVIAELKQARQVAEERAAKAEEAARMATEERALVFPTDFLPPLHIHPNTQTDRVVAGMLARITRQPRIG